MEQHTQRRSGTGRRRNRTRGQALVEFALVLPIFMVLLVGMLDAGFALYNKMTIISAAREGARAAVSIDTTNAIALASIPNVVQSAAIQAAGAGGITIDNSHVTVACVAIKTTTPPCNFGSGPGTAAQQGDAVKVTVTYTYPTLFKFLFGAGIDMDSVVQMVLDN